ncbi:MAG: hypothetical protein JWQ03_1633 [Variovorax sp.]|nr:hypothetical protein [Variovorax sp.]
MGIKYTEDDFLPLLNAMRANGGELTPPQAREYMKISDKRNLARAMNVAIDMQLVHRVQRGPNVIYRMGPDPEGGQLMGSFEPVLYGDGTLVLTGCPMSDDDRPVLNKVQASRLKALLNGLIVP